MTPMKRVTVDAASLTYEVLIEKGILDEAGKLIREISDAEIAVVVSETTVFPIYGERLVCALEKEGFSVITFVFPAGEQSKNTGNLVRLWEFLAANHVTRKDVLVALGGGVTGDLTGFAAATFLRGIKYVGIPTTLLSMVDSSVGGKTAVDLKGGKNLAGAFYQPSRVLIDPLTLDTLAPAVYADGMAEVIKYGMINKPDFLTELKNGTNIERIIEVCVTAKRDIVDLDEKDTGIRGLLNFGHTPAHSIELLSDFTISHGSAVAIGMMLMTRAAISAGLCDKASADILSELLTKYSLPSTTAFTASQLTENALNDKKRAGESITLVIPQEAGRCILKKFPVSELENFISGAWDK